MKRGGMSGFTIVETLIVLTVSGVLFISLMGMVAGQQNKARFKSAMTDALSQIQTQIGEVSSGYYPTNEQFSCSAPPTGDLIITSAAANQGTNQGCTFMGRAFMFDAITGEEQTYHIHTLVGRRLASGANPDTRTASDIAVVAPSATKTTVPDVSTRKVFQYGATVESMIAINDDGTQETIAGFAIVTAPDGQLGSGVSGTVLAGIYPIRCTTLGCDRGIETRAGVDLLTERIDDATERPIRLCIQSGTNDQSGLIVIGANRSADSIEMTIHNNKDCS